MEVYKPSDDSFFFSDFLKNYFLNPKTKEISYLDMGCGSCILAETASEFIEKKNISCADINKKATQIAKQKSFKAFHSNLFSKIPKNRKFDLITFNAPYLPEDKKEPKNSRTATTGGKKGDEISLKFLNQSQRYLNPNGKIFLLISSLTPMTKIKRFKPKIVATKKLFMEELRILEI